MKKEIRDGLIILLGFLISLYISVDMLTKLWSICPEGVKMVGTSFLFTLGLSIIVMLISFILYVMALIISYMVTQHLLEDRNA